MTKGFWKLIWSSFLKIRGDLLGFIGVALWFFSPDTSIPLRLALVIGIFCLPLIVTFVKAAYEALEAANAARKALEVSKQILPKLIRARKSSNPQGAQHLFLLEPSNLFSHDILVSFYINDSGFERFIGAGKVINVQIDGKIQVQMFYPLSEHKETLDKLVNNDAMVLERTVVKPNLPEKYLREIL